MSASVWFDRPIVTLLVGAFITVVLVPFAARRWASKQKELEVKTSLVSDIADTTMTFVTTITTIREALRIPPVPYGTVSRGWRVLGWQLTMRRDPMTSNSTPSRAEATGSVGADELETTRAAFKVRQQVIGTRLEAYFGWSGIPEQWDQLCAVVELLAPARNDPLDPGAARHRQAELDRKVEGLWTALTLTAMTRTEADAEVPTGDSDYEWRLARIRLLYCKAEIVRRILRDPMPVFEWRYSRARRRYLRQERERSTARPRRTLPA
jgi:hypothetical protein